MIDARENIHYNQFLKLSSTYWSAVANGEGCLTTIPRGKVSIITTINGDKRVVSSISLRNSGSVSLSVSEASSLKPIDLR